MKVHWILPALWYSLLPPRVSLPVWVLLSFFLGSTFLIHSPSFHPFSNSPLFSRIIFICLLFSSYLSGQVLMYIFMTLCSWNKGLNSLLFIVLMDKLDILCIFFLSKKLFHFKFFNIDNFLYVALQRLGCHPAVDKSSSVQAFLHFPHR